MENLATQAFKARKINKKECQEIIENAYNGEELTKNHLALLYKYFMPKPPKKAKNKFNWLQNCVSKDKRRQNLHAIYCDGDHLIATDGQIMCYATEKSDYKGYFDQNGNKIDLDGGNISTANTVINESRPEKIELNKKDLLVYGAGKQEYFLIETVHGKIKIRVKLLEKALNGKNNFLLHYNSNHCKDGSFYGSVKITGLEFGESIIMSLR